MDSAIVFFVSLWETFPASVQWFIERSSIPLLWTFLFFVFKKRLFRTILTHIVTWPLIVVIVISMIPFGIIIILLFGVLHLLLMLVGKGGWLRGSSKPNRGKAGRTEQRPELRLADTPVGTVGRPVTHVKRNSEAELMSLHGKWGYVDKWDAIEQIESGSHQYYIKSASEEVVFIDVGELPNGEQELRCFGSHPDVNLLDALPDIITGETIL